MRLTNIIGLNEKSRPKITKPTKITAPSPNRSRNYALAVLNSLLETSPIGFAFVDRQLTFRKVNKFLARLNDFAPELHIGKTFKEVMPAFDKEATWLIKRVFRTRRPVLNIELQGTTPRNLDRPTTLLVSFFPVESQGQIIGVGILVQDITATKLLEQQYRDNEQKFRLIAENAQDLICLTDMSGRYVYTSPSYGKVLGYSAKELLRMSPLEMIHPEDMANITDWHQAELFEFRYRRKNGGWLWLEGSSFPVTSEGQSYVVGIARDVSERKLIEIKKDEFISMASHELKTPITSMRVFTQVLKRKYKQPETLKYLDRMDHQLDRLTNLVQQLLDVSKINAGHLSLDSKIFSLNNLIKEVVENLTAANITHKIIIHGRIGKKLRGDSERIGQVLINLLTNAIKYSPNAESVVVSVREKNKEAVVGVTDQGFGIASEHLPKIFDRFYRVYDTKDSTFPGLGMGLYISSNIVRAHGGTMWASSKVGKGSTFYFSLPLCGVKEK